MLCCKCGDEIIPGREVHKFYGGVLILATGTTGEGGGTMCEKCAFPSWQKRLVTNWWFKFAVVVLALSFLLYLASFFFKKGQAMFD